MNEKYWTKSFNFWTDKLNFWRTEIHQHGLTPTILAGLVSAAEGKGFARAQMMNELVEDPND